MSELVVVEVSAFALAACCFYFIGRYRATTRTTRSLLWILIKRHKQGIWFSPMELTIINQAIDEVGGKILAP
jgi:hypothetical protein